MCVCVCVYSIRFVSFQSINKILSIMLHVSLWILKCIIPMLFKQKAGLSQQDVSSSSGRHKYWRFEPSSSQFYSTQNYTLLSPSPMTPEGLFVPPGCSQSKANTEKQQACVHQATAAKSENQTQGKLREVWRSGVEYRACDVMVKLYFLGYRSPEQLHLLLELALFGARYWTMDLRRSLPI